jgi:hypothetical protein
MFFGLHVPETADDVLAVVEVLVSAFVLWTLAGLKREWRKLGAVVWGRRGGVVIGGKLHGLCGSVLLVAHLFIQHLLVELMFAVALGSILWGLLKAAHFIACQ